MFFAECNAPIETVQNTSTGLLDALNDFKRACSRAGVTGSAKASLEECIDGLKQLIRTDDDEDGLEVIQYIDCLELTICVYGMLHPMTGEGGEG